eukprot:scaffold133432_cov22-Cyclotella_meneghiniana.AAC.1
MARVVVTAVVAVVVMPILSTRFTSGRRCTPGSRPWRYNTRTRTMPPLPPPLCRGGPRCRYRPLPAPRMSSFDVILFSPPPTLAIITSVSPTTTVIIITS